MSLAATPMPPAPDAVQAIAGRVLATIDEFIPRMGQAYRKEIAEYAELPSELMEREVLFTSRHVVEGFFVAIERGEDTRAIGIHPAVGGAGRRRLRMGVPLEAGLHAFRIAGRVVWEAVVEATRTGEEAALATLAAHWIDYVDRASTAFAEGYLEASHQHLRRLDTRRSAIVDAILEAKDVGDVAAVASEYSLTLAETYAPVLVDGHDVATRIDTLTMQAPKDTLAGFRGNRILLLVPHDVAASALRSLAHGRELLAWAPAAPAGPGLAAAVHQAASLLDAVSLAGHTEGIFGPDDLVLEQLLARNPTVHQAIDRLVLRPLAERDPGGTFLSTLTTYLACGSVPQTARTEVCHANTVAYRLKRVKEITGLDPHVPTEAALLVVATKLEGHHP